MDDNRSLSIDRFPSRGYKTSLIIAGLASALVFVFIIVILTYMYVFNTSSMHNIIVTNNSNSPINVIFGANSSSGYKFLPTKELNIGESFTYKSTPSVNIMVQGYRPGDINFSGINPFTTVMLQLSGNKFSGKTQVTDGSAIINNLIQNTESHDIYGVSVQNGYNLPVTITSTSFNNRNNNDMFSCVGPIWYSSITSCPSQLQAPSPDNYQVCQSACRVFGTDDYCCKENNSCGFTGGCESVWPDQNYYNIFSQSCPNCLITNCDNPNYRCESFGGLSEYTITFLSI